MENKGNIEELTEKPQSNGGTFFHLTIQGKSYSVFQKTPAYEQLTKREFKLGETVGFDYTESPNKKYPTNPYKNIVEFHKVEQAQHINIPGVTNTIKETSAPDWAAKDRRIVRMASINAANELLRTNQIALPDEAKMITEITLFKLAGMIEDWVYREDKKTLSDLA